MKKTDLRGDEFKIRPLSHERLCWNGGDAIFAKLLVPTGSANCERVENRHGAILRILLVRFGFNARRSRHHGSWSSEQRTRWSERERRGTRERGRRQNKETTNAPTCDDMWMNMFYTDTSCNTLSHNVMCAQGWKCREKVSCEVYLSTHPSVTVDRYQL